MKLYLVRHGEAKAAEIDPSRGLTEQGIQDVTKIAQFLQRARIGVKEIFHSGKARAQQTAAIIGRHITVEHGVFDSDGLSPNDDPSIWTVRLSRRTEDTMLVGHLPHLAKLAARLVCDDPRSPLVTFRSAGVICVVRSPNGWAIDWMVIPDIIQ